MSMNELSRLEIVCKVLDKSLKQSEASDILSISDRQGGSFYLTNMCPQVPNFNRGKRKELEQHVRNLLLRYWGSLLGLCICHITTQTEVGM